MPKLVVFTAHPDDNILVAGTMLKLKARGWKIAELLLCRGALGGYYGDLKGKTLTEVREKEIQEFARRIGYERVEFIYPPPHEIVEHEEVVRHMVRFLREERPDILILPFKDDYHREHRLVFQAGLEAVEMAVMRAYYDLGKEPAPPPIILQTDGINLLPRPHLIVDISPYLEKKIETARESYPSQLTERFLSFLEGLSKIRGTAIGVRAGEAFNITTLPSRPTFISKKQFEAFQVLLEREKEG